MTSFHIPLTCSSNVVDVERRREAVRGIGSSGLGFDGNIVFQFIMLAISPSEVEEFFSLFDQYMFDIIWVSQNLSIIVKLYGQILRIFYKFENFWTMAK